MITVPRRDINSKLKPILAASRRHLFEDVAFSIPPFRVLNRVGCGIGRPQAEAIVMLGGDDHALHSSVLDYPGPPAAIERRRVEIIRANTAFTPFLIGECIHSKMNECVVLQLLPGQLSMCRHRQDRRGPSALQQKAEYEKNRLFHLDTTGCRAAWTISQISDAYNIPLVGAAVPWPPEFPAPAILLRSRLLNPPQRYSPFPGRPSFRPQLFF